MIILTWCASDIKGGLCSLPDNLEGPIRPGKWLVSAVRIWIWCPSEVMGGLCSQPNTLDDHIMNTMKRAYRSNVPLIMSCAVSLSTWCPPRGHWRPCHENCSEATGPPHHEVCKCLPAWCSLFSRDLRVWAQPWHILPPLCSRVTVCKGYTTVSHWFTR